MDISKRDFQVWHPCLCSCEYRFGPGCFLGMITNHVLQPYYHIVVMQSSADVNQINSNFQVIINQVFLRP